MVIPISPLAKRDQFALMVYVDFVSINHALIEEVKVGTDQKTFTIEQKVKGIFNKVLDITPDEIKPDAKLDESLGMDSTELVEISVALKKEFGLPLVDNEIKKTHTFNEIVKILKDKGVK